MKILDAVVICIAFSLAYFITSYIRRTMGLTFWLDFGDFLQEFLWLALISVPIAVPKNRYRDSYFSASTEMCSGVRV